MQMWQRNPAMAGPAPVIALHCSGAGAGQWRALAEALGPAYRLDAPEHYGCESTGPWSGAHVFTLADEAARTFDLIDRSKRKVHLIGHSYGGGVALHVALAWPDRISSLTLYEPSAFHLLEAMGDRGAAAFAEIAEVARKTGTASLPATIAAPRSRSSTTGAAPALGRRCGRRCRRRSSAGCRRLRSIFAP